MMGGLVGIVLALVIIVCLELLNNKVRSVEDIEERTGCPVIGEVASFNGSKKQR